MAPRLNRSQVEMLIKKRTHLSDHQLYEMMNSKQVFQTQTGLGRELERMTKTIKHDEKIMLASLHCQKAMFLKKVEAKKRNMKYLMSVKISLKDTDSIDDVGKESSVAKEDNENLENITKGIESNTKANLTDCNNDNSSNNRRAIETLGSTSNEMWMKRLIEHSKKRAAKSKRVKDAEGKHGREESFSKSDRLSARQSTISTNSRSAHSFRRSNLEMHSNAGNVQHNNKIHKRADLAPYRSLSDLSPRTRSSSLRKTRKDLHPCNKLRQKSASSVSNLKPLVPRVQKLQRDCKDNFKKPVMEKTITMLYIESENMNNWPTASPFDIETWLKQNRRKRGYSIEISSNLLQDFDSSDANTAPNYRKGLKNTSRLDVKKPKSLQQKPLHFRQISAQPINSRERGITWFDNFNTNKKKKMTLGKNDKHDNVKTLKPLPGISKNQHSFPSPRFVLPPIGRTKDGQ